MSLLLPVHPKPTSPVVELTIHPGDWDMGLAVWPSSWCHHWCSLTCWPASASHGLWQGSAALPLLLTRLVHDWGSRKKFTSTKIQIQVSNYLFGIHNMAQTNAFLWCNVLRKWVKYAKSKHTQLSLTGKFDRTLQILINIVLGLVCSSL